MGMKNSSNKSSILKKEGFYVVLFLCLCVVAVLTVYISKANSLKAQQELAKNNAIQVEERIQDAEEVNNAVTQKEEKNTVKEKEDSGKKENENTKETSKAASSKQVTLSLISPVTGEVSKKFSGEDLQHTKALDIWETHEGIDIACSLGAEVKAAEAGKVVDIYNDDKAEKTLKSGYGVTVVLEHDNGYRTVYANLAENLNIKKGDSIEAGSVIGSVGDTTVREDIKVDGAHLHFGLLQKDGNDYKSVDPTSYIKK